MVVNGNIVYGKWVQGLWYMGTGFMVNGRRGIYDWYTKGLGVWGITVEIPDLLWS